MKKILFIAGARPNFMKISALIKAAEKYKDKIKIDLVHTGQHYDDEMSQIFFDEFKMPAPTVNLGIGSGDRITQTRMIFQKLFPYIEKEKPDLVIVVGDVLSSAVAAQTSVFAGVPVAHIEAGLRSFNWKMPEELNRVLMDNLSDLLFVTEESAIVNLKNENTDDKKIYFVGNVMIDTLFHFRKRAKESEILKKLNLEKNNFVLATFHRQENVDNKELLQEIIEALNEISKFLPVVVPLHPRTKKAIEASGLNGLLEKLIIINPQSYFDFLNLEMNTMVVITDSGGIQEEASIFGVPCITCRTETERPVTCELGTNEIAGVSKEKIIALAMKANSGDWKKGGEILLWDGHAAERIMKIIDDYLKA